ncbi:50S ribosomal protein L29 [Candidatus Pacearchaeota archaeon]|nr:50S ribosomal protein L29 [Candidatus Pacearchaeota archaeon]
MAVLKFKDAEKISEQEIPEKLKELRQELIKANVSAKKSGKNKIKEIKKAIARILTAQRMRSLKLKV